MTIRAESSIDLAFPIISDWEQAYSNRRAVANVDDWMADTAAAARQFRGAYAGQVETDLAYGDGGRERVDILHPLGRPKGIVVFIHGGYWRAGTKEEHWIFARGALANDWRVALIEYPLCPAASIRGIAHSARKALEFVATHIADEPIVLSGHSAGGHLASFLMTPDSTLCESVRTRVRKVVSLSGLHDLRPLVHALELNKDLQLDATEATRLSPALLQPQGHFDLVCIAGDDELPEFRRQNALLANIWSGFGLCTRAVEIPGRNHFTLLDGLGDGHSVITEHILGSTA